MKFLKYNLNSPLIWILSIVYFFLVGLILFFGFKMTSLIGILISISLFLLYLFLVYFGINAKIRILDNGIEYKSFFRYRFIEWAKIKTYGVYRISRNNFEILDVTKYDNYNFWYQKFIFISEHHDYLKDTYKKQKETIEFHYRKDAFIKIIEMINKI